jgi:hypothetical protein
MALLVSVFGFDKAFADDGCPQGTFSVINSPDGTSLTVLFDSFSISGAGGLGKSIQEKTCTLNVPLHLPEGQSLGVYRVDYRGFAHLAAHQYSELTVDYALGPREKSRRYHRRVPGAHEGDFLFTENIGAGLMRRVGCGEAALLRLTITLSLQTKGAGEALAAMDSADGAPKGGLVYYFDLKRCG